MMVLIFISNVTPDVPDNEHNPLTQIFSDIYQPHLRDTTVR